MHAAQPSPDNPGQPISERRGGWQDGDCVMRMTERMTARRLRQPQGRSRANKRTRGNERNAHLFAVPSSCLLPSHSNRNRAGLPWMMLTTLDDDDDDDDDDDMDGVCC